MLRHTHLTIVVTMSGVLLAPPIDASEIWIGIGESRKEGPQAAGREAAARAQVDLGDHEVRLVLVFDNVADNAEGKRELMAGVAQQFPKELVFGCSAFSPLTTNGNAGTVGVLALGEDVEVAVASAGIEQGQEAAGKVIARAIGDVKTKEHLGRLLILLGGCTVPQNAAFVSGLQEVLGTELPIAGGAASRSQFVYARGKVLVDSNLGILISGPFDLRFAGGTAPSRTTEEVIAVAGEVAGKTFDPEKDDALLGLVCNCAGRHIELGTRQADAFAQIKKAALASWLISTRAPT